MDSACPPGGLRSNINASLQTIFADNTYSKPFFVTYVNTSLFILPLFTILFRRLWRLWRSRRLSQITSFQSLLRHLDSHDPKAEEEQAILHAAAAEDDFHGHERRESAQYVRSMLKDPNAKLGLKATAKLSFEFCLLWVRGDCFHLLVT
ncbi:hypothetical protein N7474_000496 [Penicillium riverlandense]|uniref:uncharacterized protein n=1 Tax=Penicillium riverlandense TaxID=1903569 RepID=UPI002547E5EB|nr:uncharacterized protein N7474_000496 [Penicillium riverlandense]KAJ5832185.1 hypothetical protein N7474_000496 [Penicillium riverlandense]